MEYFARTLNEVVLLFPGFHLGFLTSGYFSFVISAKQWRRECLECLEYMVHFR